MPESDNVPDARRRNMRAIKAKNTKPEVVVKEALSACGIEFLDPDSGAYPPGLPGKPDVVLMPDKVAIFVNGCFWHKHDCRYFKWPKTRAEFWREKLEGNAERDRKNTKLLAADGWRVLIIWECSLKGKARLSDDEIAGAVKKFQCSGGSFGEVPPVTGGGRI